MNNTSQDTKKLLIIDTNQRTPSKPNYPIRYATHKHTIYAIMLNRNQDFDITFRTRKENDASNYEM